MKTRGIPATALGLACLSLSFLAPVSTRAGDAGRPAPGPLSPDLARRLEHLTLDDAIDIALHRNPAILNQLQEIQRNDGIILQVRSAALPQLIATGTFNQTDRSLLENTASTSSGASKFQDVYLRTVDPTTGTKGLITGTQLVDAS